MNTTIILQGELRKLVVSEYEGKKTYNLQFLVEDEVKADSFIMVKISDDSHMVDGLVKGAIVKCPIKIVSMVDGKKVNTYYRTEGKIQISK